MNNKLNKLDNKELMKLNNALNDYKKQYEIIANHSADLIYHCDLHGQITSVNESTVKAFNLREEELLKKNIQEILLSEKSRNNWEQIIASINNNISVHFDDIIFLKNIGFQIFKVSLFPLTNAHNEVTGIIGIHTNITNIKENEKIIRHLAYYDLLTQLPNRLLFTQECFKIMEAAKVSRKKMAIAFIDIDDFKKINDTLGHYWGDHLLIEFAKNAKECLRVNEYIGRFGGDEFVIAFSNIRSSDSIVSRVEKVKKELEEHTYKLNSMEYHISLSIGIALYPDHGNSIDDLYKKSDIAMYRAKDAGKSRVVLYDASHQCIEY